MPRFNDRIVLPPPTAQKTNMTCHFCIVGCGYHVYKWPEFEEGGRAPQENALGIDFRRQVPSGTLTLSPDMQNVVTDRTGKRSNILIVPDRGCPINRGLSSARGGRLASSMYAPDFGTKERLTHPMLREGSQWSMSTWEESLALYAALTKKILEEDGPDGLFFNCFDHGGAGGGFENTWATGKLMFSALGTQMVRIHNRPAYNSECHATRDMGVSELNNSYQDAALADVLFAAGCNPYETQTNYFLQHWMPNLRGENLAWKKDVLREPVEAAKLIIVDPRRTNTVAICEAVIGPENVLHLDLEPGTDAALFNAIFTYVVSKGWHDQAFIEGHSRDFDIALKKNRLTLKEAAAITGVAESNIEKAARWAYEPKANGLRKRTMHAYEKGLIWGNDNYNIQAAFVNLSLATRNIGREGTGCVRMGGHQEGYARPPYPGTRKIDLDQEVIKGRGLMYTAWGANPLQTTLNADAHRSALIKRCAVATRAMSDLRGLGPEKKAAKLYTRLKKEGGLFFTSINLYPTSMQDIAHLMLPAAHPGEMNHTSMNGERRLKLTQKFMDPPGTAQPDCLIAAAIGKELRKSCIESGNHSLAKRFSGFDWQSEEDVFNDGFRAAGQKTARKVESQGGDSGHFATYERLIQAGNEGVQLPIQNIEQGKLIGTPRLYSDGIFSTADGKARFKASPWNGLPTVLESQKKRYGFWINNGRTNQAWQSGYHDVFNDVVRSENPMPVLEINSDDAKALSIEGGDVVELYNDFGSAYALAYIEPSMKRKQTFMQFAHGKGVIGNLVSPWTDRNIIPYYKGVWADLRRVGGAGLAQSLSFKSRRFQQS